MPTLPSDAKIRWGTRRYLVRQIAERFVPESIRKCKRKFGTVIPLTGWLIAGKDYIEEILDSVEFSERGYNVENIRHTYKKVRPQFDPIQDDLVANQLCWVNSLKMWLRKRPAHIIRNR